MPDDSGIFFSLFIGLKLSADPLSLASVDTASLTPAVGAPLPQPICIANLG
jgi:hypothetical protein